MISVRTITPQGSGLLPKVAVVLLFAAFIANRPNILGERFTFLALGLAIVALLLVVHADGAVRFSSRTLPVVTMLMLAQSWLLFRRGDTGQEADPRATVILLVVLLITSVVLSDLDRARMFARIFVGAVLVLCASCVVTAALFLVGLQLPLFTFFTGQFTASFLFPLTPSIGSVWVSGELLPRFSGIGREPGWMGMYIAFATVAWRWVGKPRWWGYLILAGGLLCTLSTAGFGIYIVVVAYEVFLRARDADTPFAKMARRVTGVALMAGAAWLALYAPVVGLLAKSDVNSLSLDERSYVMAAGFEALKGLSLGEQVTYVNSGIGLVAATAPNGWPYFMFVSLAFLLPFFRMRGAAPIAMVAVLYLTLLLAQPPQDSIAVYMLLLAAFALTKRDRCGLPEGLGSVGAPAYDASNAAKVSAHIK